MNAGDFFRVFARLKQQDDVPHTCLCSFDDRLSSVDSRITNNVGMHSALNSHSQQLLSSSIVSVAQKSVIVNHCPGKAHGQLSELFFSYSSTKHEIGAPDLLSAKIFQKKLDSARNAR